MTLPIALEAFNDQSLFRERWNWTLIQLLDGKTSYDHLDRMGGGAEVGAVGLALANRLRVEYKERIRTGRSSDVSSGATT